MKIEQYSTPLDEIVRQMGEAELVGAKTTISMAMVAQLDRQRLAEIVNKDLTVTLSNEMMLKTLVHRTMKRAEQDYQADQVEYRCTVAVVPIKAWLALQDVVALMALDKAVGDALAEKTEH